MRERMENWSGSNQRIGDILSSSPRSLKCIRSTSRTLGVPFISSITFIIKTPNSLGSWMTF
ncbi:FYVE_ RhoGEF and PH domaincontaining protein 4like, partial [Caligus rogercresseyi]